MNVIDQALNVVQRTELLEGPVTLTLDLAVPEHRAALAAALAVLRSLGEDGETLLAGAEGTGAAATAIAPVAAVAVPEAGTLPRKTRRRPATAKTAGCARTTPGSSPS